MVLPCTRIAVSKWAERSLKPALRSKLQMASPLVAPRGRLAAPGARREVKRPNRADQSRSISE